jgi:thiol-disulfide isomerase/thioredoxin
MKSRINVFLFLLGLAVVAPSSNLFGQIVIHGTVIGGDGQRPVSAYAHFGNYNEITKLSKSYPCTMDGTFEITVPEPGIYSLRVSAVDHEEATIPLVLQASDKTVELTVQLKPNPVNDDLSKLAVVGDWNNFDWSSAQTMKKIIDGEGHTIYIAERTATADTISYQLIGLSKGRSVNGTRADYFVYDGGGDYRSVLRTHRGNPVTIFFDRSLLLYPKNDNLPIVTVKNNIFLQKSIALTMKVDAMRKAAMVVPTQGGPVTISSAKVREMGEFVKADFQKELDSGDSLSAQYAGVIRASQYSPNSFSFGADEASLILNTVPASSPFWAMASTEAWALTKVVDPSFGHEYQMGLESNPDKSVRGTAFCSEMQAAYEAKNDKEWKRLYAIVKNEYSDVPMAKYALIQYNPDADVMVGKHVPGFEVTTLGGSQKVSDKSMLGKYYMIDFWATWCGPCVGEMASMHSAYEKFKGKKGFEIVSLSMDAAENNITPFRKKWKMPWVHAFIPGIWDAELAKKFEVASIPKPILVGPDGTIVAMAESLRGDELEKTLSKYLGVSD